MAQTEEKKKETPRDRYFNQALGFVRKMDALPIPVKNELCRYTTLLTRPEEGNLFAKASLLTQATILGILCSLEDENGNPYFQDGVVPGNAWLFTLAAILYHLPSCGGRAKPLDGVFREMANAGSTTVATYAEQLTRMPKYPADTGAQGLAYARNVINIVRFVKSTECDVQIAGLLADMLSLYAGNGTGAVVRRRYAQALTALCK